MNRAQGFSLIEILVTLLLVGVGLLGMTLLQGKAIAYSKGSSQRNAAAMAANELLELMRANPKETLTSDGKLKGDSAYLKARNASFAAPSAACTPTPAQAAAQLACWAQALRDQLPIDSAIEQQEFYICRSSTVASCTSTGSAIEIQIAWRVRKGECLEEQKAATPTICHYRLRSEI